MAIFVLTMVLGWFGFALVLMRQLRASNNEPVEQQQRLATIDNP